MSERNPRFLENATKAFGQPDILRKSQDFRRGSREPCHDNQQQCHQFSRLEIEHFMVTLVRSLSLFSRGGESGGGYHVWLSWTNVIFSPLSNCSGFFRNRDTSRNRRKQKKSNVLAAKSELISQATKCHTFLKRGKTTHSYGKCCGLQNIKLPIKLGHGAKCAIQ